MRSFFEKWYITIKNSAIILFRNYTIFLKLLTLGIAPKLLKSKGSIIVNDYNCELLQKCGVELIQKGYKIKILDLCKLSQSNHYNPFQYIYDEDGRIKETYVYDLAKCVCECFDKYPQKQQKKNYINNDLYFRQSEIILLRSVIYYVAEKYKKEPLKKNFRTVLELINLLYVDDTEENKLGVLFKNYKEKYGVDNMVIDTYNYFDIAVCTLDKPQVRKKIKEELCLYLSLFNYDAIQDITCVDDTMELDRIGMPINENELKMINDKSIKESKNGKVAYFINANPYDLRNCMLASIFYTQIFEQLTANKLNHNDLPIYDTPVDIFLDNFQEFADIPNFHHFLCCCKFPNKKMYFSLQDLSWLKNNYSYWEELLDLSTVIEMDNYNKKNKKRR